jgi:hypothetical protein
MIIIGALSEGAPVVVYGTGDPVNASHPDGSEYHKTDGTAAAKDVLWHAESGVWVKLVP